MSTSERTGIVALRSSDHGIGKDISDSLIDVETVGELLPEQYGGDEPERKDYKRFVAIPSLKEMGMLFTGYAFPADMNGKAWSWGPPDYAAEKDCLRNDSPFRYKEDTYCTLVPGVCQYQRENNRSMYHKCSCLDSQIPHDNPVTPHEVFAR